MSDKEQEDKQKESSNKKVSSKANDKSTSQMDEELAERKKKAAAKKRLQEEEEADEQERARRKTSRVETKEVDEEEAKKSKKEKNKKGDNEEQDENNDEEQNENNDEEQDENNTEKQDGEQDGDNAEEQTGEQDGINTEEQTGEQDESYTEEQNAKQDENNAEEGKDTGIDENNNTEGSNELSSDNLDTTGKDSGLDSDNLQNNNNGVDGQFRQNDINKNVNSMGGQASQTAGQGVAQNTAQQATQQATQKAAQQAAQDATRTAAKAAAQTGTKTAIAPAITSIIVVILIIIVVIGILFFFITMPGMVVGKIGEAINSFMTDVANFFDGNNAVQRSITKDEVVKAAKYVEDMGYDLQGYGFLTDEAKSVVSGKPSGKWYNILDQWANNGDEDNTRSIDIGSFTNENYKERATNDSDGEILEVYLSKKFDDIENEDEDTVRDAIVMIKNQDGEIEYAKSKYLAMYMMADYSSYMVSNDNTNFWNRVSKLWGGNNESDGAGMITFINPSDYNKVSEYVIIAEGAEGIEKDDFVMPEGFLGSNKYKISKEDNTLEIDNAEDGIFKFSHYTYSLDGWIIPYRITIAIFSCFTFI